MAEPLCGMWFGTEERQEWIRPPDEGVTIGNEGWGAQGTYLSGGAFVRRSGNRHKTYTMSWTEINGDDLAVLTDYHDGLYGEGPFYFVLPGTTKNILPQSWATPRLACVDAPPLVEGVRPAPVPASSTPYRRPTTSAMYTVSGSDQRRQVLPLYVPEGTTLHLGVHGSFSAGIRMEYSVNGAATPMLSVVGDQLTNYTVAGPAKVELSLQGEGTATINSMTAALSNDEVPFEGAFVSGKGHSGVQFPANSLTTTLLSASRDAWSAAVSFVEVGQWR